MMKGGVIIGMVRRDNHTRFPAISVLTRMKANGRATIREMNRSQETEEKRIPCNAVRGAARRRRVRPRVS